MREALLAQADAQGHLSFAQFMDVALYAPGLGYYQRERERVGRAGADFITAASVGPVLGQLVCAALTSLLPDAPHRYTLVELGAETGIDVFSELDLPFADYRRRSLGDALDLQGPCAVFANELLDAQPALRLRWDGHRWRERGVHVPKTGPLHEIELADLSPEAQTLLPDLPTDLPAGYQLDYSVRAEALWQDLIAQDWHGVLLTLDYGRSWETLTVGTPGGTARAYWQHQQQTDLLARPGLQDLTTDVAWDRLEAMLQQHRFTHTGWTRQEAFFVQHAETVARQIVEQGRDGFAPQRALMSLLHPAHFGARFQALWGTRSHLPR